MALMLRAELGWTTANPPDTIANRFVSFLKTFKFIGRSQSFRLASRHRGEHTEELLAAALLNNLNQTGLELLNGGHVVGQDTHLSRLGGQVDLDDILGLVEGLRCWVR